MAALPNELTEVVRKATEAYAADVLACLQVMAWTRASARARRQGDGSAAPAPRPEDFAGEDWRQHQEPEMRALGRALAGAAGADFLAATAETMRAAALEHFVIAGAGGAAR